MISLPITRHRFWQLVVDGVLVAAAWYLAFRLRFDPKIPPYYHTMFTRTIWIVLLIQLATFILFGFYNRWWRYVSTRDMWGAARGVTVACLVSSVVVYFANPVAGVRLPRSVAIMDWLLLLAFVAGARMLARTLMERPTARGLVARGKEVIVVGAGDAAQLIIKELLRSPSLGYTPIGLVDDDPRKKNLRVHNVRVLGTTEELPRILSENRPDEVLIAIPSASGEVRQRIVDITREAGVPVKTLPGIYELISGDVDLAGQIRPVQVEDVLGREPVEVDLATIATYVRDATVLVTGAGGSIGAELCRQIARIGCKRLILVDQAETPLFEIERELVSERGFAPSVPVLADVGNRPKMRHVFERYTPSVVFHAAAYKHVPLMEANPLESVRNNTLATRVMAEVAVEFGVERFVLVSTDKAVNAKTVMGQSKALCEWIVEAYGARRDIPTRFVAVRFGNVLGSSGQRDPDLPPPDRARRAGHRDAPGDDALLHDDSGGGFPDRPGRVNRPFRPGVRARHGRGGLDRRPRPQHDSPLWQGARPGHRDRIRRRAARREAARGALGRGRVGRRHAASEDPRGHAAGDRRGVARGRARRARTAGGRRRDAGSRVQARRDDEGAAPRWLGRRRTPRRVTASRGSRRA